MTPQEILKQLKAMGTAQNRKVLARHGASTTKCYGVSFANLGKLKKKIKTNHELALKLWDSEIEDAQVLACMIADPNKFTKTQANKWIKNISYVMISNYLGSLIAKTPHAIETMEKWMKAKKEYTLNTAYSTLSSLLKDSPDTLNDKQCRTYLKTIEAQIHSAPNRGKSAMNWALIALGGYKKSIRKEVLAAAKRIGSVDIDHGETSCKTPDAHSYIKKMEKKEKSKK